MKKNLILSGILLAVFLAALFVRAGYRLYLEHLMPLAGKRISGDISAYRYLASSVEHFPLPEAFLPELAACGFSRVRHRALSLGICRLYTACRED